MAWTSPAVRRWLGRGALSVGIAYGYSSMLVGGFVAASQLGKLFASEHRSITAVLGLLCWAGISIGVAQTTGRQRRVAFEILALVVLPAWGLVINIGLPEADACVDQNRLLAMPQAWPFYGLHAATVLAYSISRRHEFLPLGQELVVRALLLCGVVQMALLAIQFNALPLFGLIFGPIGLPLVAPWLVGALYAWTLATRRARPIHFSVQRTSIGLSGLILGLYGALHAAWLGGTLGALEVFVRTASGTFGVIEPPPTDCHYLCTVAAQGHPALVRPLRWGRRRGQPILVNRQLAVANAFEDLLHERWPWLGRLARTCYDALAFDLSRHLRRRWTADLVYLLMKPAEIALMVALLLLDRGAPEERIDRMYR